MNNWSAEAWRRVVESAPEGIVICDAQARDCPVLFVNGAFAEMCGYPVSALLGTNLRILQGTDHRFSCQAMTNGIAPRAQFAFFASRTGASPGIATVCFDLLETCHGASAAIGFVS